jgi:hypothetical protein
MKTRETKTGMEKSTIPCLWKIKSGTQNRNRERKNMIEEHAQIWEQHNTSTRKMGTKPEQNQKFCSINTEQGLHLTTEVIALSLDEYIDNTITLSLNFESKTSEAQLEDQKPKKSSRRSSRRR